MISSKLGSEADLDHSALSDSSSATTETSSYYQSQGIKNKGAAEPRKRVKKLRSIKLVKLPSLRINTRQGKIQSDRLSILSSDAVSSLQPTQGEIPYASPNYMRTTTSSDAKKESLQKSARSLTRRTSFRPAKSLTRLSSTKFRRSLMRKSSGGSDRKKKLKNSRSIKLGKRISIVIPDDADGSPDHLKSTEFSDAENAHFQASSHNSESCLSSNDESKKSSNNLNLNFASGQKFTRVITRTSSLRRPRILTKMASLRTKRPSKKSSQMLDSTVHKATCSSALKDSKLTDHLQLQPEGGSESEGIVAMKVCPYSYCSLHGHKHSTVPPLERFVSMRRRMLKTQKSIKLENQSFLEAKCSSNMKKGIQRSEFASRSKATVLETAHKSKAVTSISKMAGPKADLNGEGSNGKDGEDTIHSESATETVTGEPSSHHLCLKENMQISKSPTAEKNAVPACLLQGEASKESYTDKKEEETMESNSYKCVLTLDHPPLVDSSIQKIRSPRQCDYDKLPFDESVSACHEEIPAAGRVHKEVTGNRISSLDLDMLKGDSQPKTSQANTSTNVIDEPFNKSRNLSWNMFVESKAINGMDSSASTGEFLEQTAAGEESNEDSSAESESDGNTDVVHKTGTEKQKNMGFWNLIYQHMVSGIAQGDETQPPLNIMNREEQGEDAKFLFGMNKAGPSSDFSGIDQNMEVKDHDRGNPQIQLYQRKAIKLVQEAFDKILSEIPDQTSDDQLINCDTTSRKEVAEKNHSEGNELSISTSLDSGKDSTVQDQEEVDSKADKINEPQGEKAESKVERKYKQQAPKNWSNLKKIIIFRRFVKALEKVRRINPQKPGHLPRQPDLETEKIHLRHQTVGERKNSDEWMLDSALQQVISTLAPAQKRKVALLVQAFETVGPLPESSTSPRSNIAAISHATPVHTSTASSHQRSSETGKETNFGISLCKTFFPEKSSKKDQDQVYDYCTAEKHIPESCSLKGPSTESGSIHSEFNLDSETTAVGLKENLRSPELDNAHHNTIVNSGQPDCIKNSLVDLGEHNFCDQPSPKPADVASTSHDELLTKGEVLEEGSLTSASKVHDSDFRFNIGQKLASDYEINASGEKSDGLKNQISKRSLEGSSAIRDEVTSVPVIKMFEGSSKATEVKTMLQNKFLQALTPHEGFTSNSAEIANEKQKNMRLWHLIYKHMVSGTATALDETMDEEEQRNEANGSYEKHNSFSHQGFPITSQERDIENHTDSQRVELQQIEAIKMVEEAIDEISLPDSQDDSYDNQSVTKEIIRDQEHLEKQSDEGEEISISTSIDSTKKSYKESNNQKVEQMGPHSEEPYLNFDIEKTELDEENKPKLSTQKSWSNLKKLILLKKFFKAIEKVKKFNPREPRFLPLDPENKLEKVHLRHQGMEDRKKADEWMLDYALQQVIAKLTPSRKRKVELLVEAFETVIPTIGS